LNGTSTHSGIFVLLEGTKYATTTNAAGYFSLSFRSWPGTYGIALVKDGYSDEYIDNIYVNSNITLPSAP